MASRKRRCRFICLRYHGKSPVSTRWRFPLVRDRHGELLAEPTDGCVSAVNFLPVDVRPLRRYQAFGTIATRYFWWCFAGALLLIACNAFWRLGDTFVRDYDEARYAVAASEMLHGHSLLVTTYAGETEFWNLKPPLGYWLLCLSYRILGETPFAMRVPAAICAILTTALTMLLALRAAGRRAAILAGIILATSFGLLGHHAARGGELDVPLTLLMLLFLMLAPQLAQQRWARLAAGLVLSLGFLLKSFAILPFVAAIGLYGLITRGVGSWRMWPLPLTITLATAAIYAVARTAAEGSSEFVRRMFVEDLLLRSTTMIDPGGNSNWDYIGALFDRFAPWPLVVLLALAVSRHFATRRLSAEVATLLWCCILVPLAFFTFARTHHSWYIIPLYPAGAIMAAVAVLEVTERAARVDLAPATAAVMAVLLLACEVRVAIYIEVHDRMPESQIFLASLRERTAGMGQHVRTNFTPSYSERFFLQVVDGFVLDGSSVVNGRAAAGGLGDEMMLIRRPGMGSRGSTEVSGIPVLAQNADYLLMGGSSPSMAGTGVRHSEPPRPAQLHNSNAESLPQGARQ